MTLRVQGIAGPERAAAALGIDAEAAAERLSALAAAELATERTGKLAGFTLTTAGGDRLEKLLADEGLRTSEAMSDCYDRFMLLNKRVLAVSSDWQVRTDGGVEEPNDHSDAAYNDSVVQRLIEIHARATTCLAGLAECAPRFASYGPRLDDCVTRLEKGDVKAFTAVLAESYHTIWFELHQDLLLTLGLKREE
jgi:hypothetical protein